MGKKNDTVRQYLDDRDYEGLMTHIDKMALRIERRLESPDETGETYRMQSDARAYRAWYYRWVDSLDQVQHLDEAQAATDVQYRRLCRTAEQSGAGARRTLRRAAPLLGVGVVATMIWPATWWLWVATALAAAVTGIGAYQVATFADSATAQQIARVQQEKANLGEARRRLLEEINAEQPDTARIEMPLMS